MPSTGVVMNGTSVHDSITIAKLAEELGFADCWVTEVNGTDAVSVVAAVATHTSRIRLATGIVSTYTRSPLLMAMTANTLQDLSGGRFIAGLGTSTPPIVTGWHGLPWGKSLSHTREYVELFRRLSAGERVKHQGMFDIRGAQPQAAKHPVPVYLGALNQKMLELAGEIADGVILNFPTLRYARQAVGHIETGIKRAGRERSDVDITAFLRTAVVDDFASAANVVRRELVTYFLAPVYQRVFTEDGYGEDTKAVKAAWASGDRTRAVATISDRAVDDHAVIGTAKQCREKVRALLDVGVNRAVLVPVVSDGPERFARSLETIRTLAPTGP